MARSSDEVRRFFIDNALMWLRDFHVDALRLDAVHALLDERAITLLDELTAEADALSALLGRPLAMVLPGGQGNVVVFFLCIRRFRIAGTSRIKVVTGDPAFLPHTLARSTAGDISISAVLVVWSIRDRSGFAGGCPVHPVSAGIRPARIAARRSA